MKKEEHNIAICLAHNYPHFTNYFTMSLCNMIQYFNDWERESKNSYTLSVILQGGYELDWMRNEVTEKALKDHDILLYLDTDMSFPPETIPMMLITLESNPDYNAVCGIYTYKTPPYAPQLFLSWNKDRKAWDAMRSGFPLDKPFSLGACGAGILMVKREVLDKKPRPWFKFLKAGEDPDAPNGMGEDLYFHYYLKPKLLCHPRILCNHHGRTFANLSDYIEYNDAKVKDGSFSLTKKKLKEIEKVMGKTPILNE